MGSGARGLGLGLATMLSAIALAACSGAPTKPESSPAARVEAPPGSKPQSGRRGRSPYAPAQEDLSKRGNYTRGGLYAPGVADSAPQGGIPDVHLIPEPEVRDEPRSRYGNRSPYQVLGKSYYVLDSAEDYDETGIASYYGNKFHGRRTSSLEVYDMYAFTAAHKTLPLPSFARVTNLDNGRSVVVRVNDRGPFHDGRVIDLSYAAAVKLGVDRAGTAQVEVRGLTPGENAREPYDAVAADVQLPPGVHIATGKPAPVEGKAGVEAPQRPPPSAIDTLIGALPIASANAGERPPQAAAMVVAPDAGNPATAWRFDMFQDGRAMTADEFDAWMRSRRVRVATGKAGTPDPRPALPAAPVEAVSAPVVVAPAAEAAHTPKPVLSVPAGGPGVTLQVASFSAQDNAERALGMLVRAGIAGARLQDGNVNGLRVWRLRIGPVTQATEPELIARVRGLGFGQPQRVRE